jgi:hypothetical protein
VTIGVGLRIHHPIEKNVILIVPRPPGLNGKPADMPIHLDENGDSIVSYDIWKRLQEAQQMGLAVNEFVVLNEVLDPPTLVVGGNANIPTKRVARKAPGSGGEVHDAQALAVAQRFAPKGTKARITTNGGNR